MAEYRENRQVTIRNPQGFHLRPADMLARLANEFEADVKIAKDGELFDTKSILSLVTLGAEQGTQLTLQATGADAQQALDAMAELFERGFDEMNASESTQDSSTDG